MMHICTVATLCFPDKTVPRNYYYCVQDDNSLSLCFKSMYRILFVAIFTSAFIFSMFKSSHTYRNINISNQITSENIQMIRWWKQISEPILKTRNKYQITSENFQMIRWWKKISEQKEYQHILLTWLSSGAEDEGCLHGQLTE